MTYRTPHEAALRAAIVSALAASISAQGPGPRFDELRGSGLPPLLDDRSSLAVGDLDGDGDLDIAMPSVPGLGVLGQVLINRGGGVFVDESEARVPRGPSIVSAVSVGDVDGDGDADIVRGTWQGVEVMVNDGSGNFAAGSATSTRRVRLIELADVDGDADLDAIAVDVGPRLLLNDGSGNFADVTATHGDDVVHAGHGGGRRRWRWRPRHRARQLHERVARRAERPPAQRWHRELHAGSLGSPRSAGRHDAGPGDR